MNRRKKSQSIPVYRPVHLQGESVVLQREDEDSVTMFVAKSWVHWAADGCWRDSVCLLSTHQAVSNTRL